MESMSTVLKNDRSNAKKLVDAATCADDAAIDALAMVMVLPRRARLPAHCAPTAANGQLGVGDYRPKLYVACLPIYSHAGLHWRAMVYYRPNLRTLTCRRSTS